MLNRIGEQARTATLTPTFAWRVGLLVCMIGTFGTVMAASEATYRWHGELVTLDETSQMLMVKARAVSQAGLAGAEGLRMGARIAITWSGYENQANGIRSVALDDGSGLWGGNEFLLQAEFVAMDAEQQSLMFKAAIPDGSLTAVRSLTRGDWATVTSPHRPGDGMASLLMVDAYDVAERVRRYVWPGQIVSLNQTETTVSVSAPVEQHVFRYVDRFTAGDEVVLIWSPNGRDEAKAIRYLEHREELILDHGYVLPVQFVSAHAESQRIVFKTKLSPSMFARSALIQAGKGIKVTSPFDQSGESAAIMIVDPVPGD